MMCRHDWQEYKTVYGPPCEAKVTGYSRFVDRATFGVTTYVLLCTKCKKLRKLECLGKELP